MESFLANEQKYLTVYSIYERADIKTSVSRVRRGKSEIRPSFGLGSTRRPQKNVKTVNPAPGKRKTEYRSVGPT